MRMINIVPQTGNYHDYNYGYSINETVTVWIMLQQNIATVGRFIKSLKELIYMNSYFVINLI